MWNWLALRSLVLDRVLYAEEIKSLLSLVTTYFRGIVDGGIASPY